jgi:hypothetical protein
LAVSGVEGCDVDHVVEGILWRSEVIGSQLRIVGQNSDKRKYRKEKGLNDVAKGVVVAKFVIRR